MGSRQVLGIDVDEELITRWREWYAPERQAFRTDLLDPVLAANVPHRELEPTEEWVDTFFIYGGSWTWLDEAEFGALPVPTRRALQAVRRRVMYPKHLPVWRSKLDRIGDGPLLTWVASGARSSRHHEVPDEVWRDAAQLLPAAQRLAGSFVRTGSGPNCFGAVMAATGVAEGELIRVVLEPFQTWLDEHTEPVRGTGHDQLPGTVLVWTEHGVLAHAAVTIGGGWVFQKPSQSWSSARIVCRLTDVINSWRLRGTRLSRHRIS